MNLEEQYRRQRGWRRWDVAYRHLGDLKGQLVLDLGCGIGDQAADLAAQGARVVGIDANEELLRRARARQIAGARFVKMDLVSPVGLDGEKADGIWLGFTAAYFPDFGAALDGWSRWVRPRAWIAITEVDDLLGHEPLEPRWRRAIESFYDEARVRGAYEFSAQLPVREALASRGWQIEVEEELPDDELSFHGAATASVFEAWRLRLGRMPGLAAFLGGDAAEFRQSFLDGLRAPQHRTRSRVWFLLARRAGQ